MDGDIRLPFKSHSGCGAFTTSCVFFPAYTFTWCSSTSIFAGVKRYLRYISSGGCFYPSRPDFTSSFFSAMKCSTTTTGSPSRSSSRFPCFFFGLRWGASSCPTAGTSTETASASYKEYGFPVHFYKGDLVFNFMPLRRSAKTVPFQIRHLFQYRLEIIVNVL